MLPQYMCTPMSAAALSEVPALLVGLHRILVIGGAVVRRLLRDSEALVFNLDKCGYASELISIDQVLVDLGDRASTPEGESHVDCSIEGPGAFITSNVNGTFSLL